MSTPSEPEEPEPEEPEHEEPSQKIHYCEVCRLSCKTAMILQTHLAGMRHKKREKALKITSNPVTFEEPLTVKKPLSKTVRCLKDYMKDPNREEPLIGLEYVLEIRFRGRKDPSYECQLCEFSTELVPMIEHLIGQRHRKTYLMKHYPGRDKRAPNQLQEDRISFLKRIAGEVEKEEGLKMYKVEACERPSITSTAAKKKAKWRDGVYRPENDPVRRQKALEYMNFFEIKSDIEATQVIRVAQSLSKTLKTFCEKKNALKHIRSLPPLIPALPRNTKKQTRIDLCNKPQKTSDDNPGDTKRTPELPSSNSPISQMMERPSSYTEGSHELATVSALRESLAPQPGNPAGGINEWMKQFRRPASVDFQSNPLTEESLYNLSSESSYPTRYHEQSSIQKYDDRMADTGTKGWGCVRDSYAATRENPPSFPSKYLPSWYNDGKSNQKAVSLPVANESLGWPQSSGYQKPNLQTDGKAYRPPCSDGSSYSDYQHPNRTLNNITGRSPSGLSSNVINQLRGQDPATLARMLQELVPHYPDLQKIDIYALAESLSRLT